MREATVLKGMSVTGGLASKCLARSIELELRERGVRQAHTSSFGWSLRSLRQLPVICIGLLGFGATVFTHDWGGVVSELSHDMGGKCFFKYWGWGKLSGGGLDRRSHF